MLETLADMSWPIFVLIICGGGTLILGWWLAVVGEGRDEWLTGDDE